MADSHTTSSTAERKHQCSLSEEIKTASRSVHTLLNSLVIAHLPLALPPHTNTPSLYAIGLLHFTPIYAAFESIWTDIVQHDPLRNSPPIENHVFCVLRHLYLPALLRLECLSHDLARLLHEPLDDIYFRLQDQTGQQLQEFVVHIGLILTAKPHVMVAYAWVMYMALFNGGRWIRKQLIQARDSSWDLSEVEDDTTTRDPFIVELVPTGLEFWHFPGPADGEDVKIEFKTCLAEVESLLTPAERSDIVNEAIYIFQRCALLVKELDEVIAEQQLDERVPVPLLAPYRYWLLPESMMNLIGVFLRWVIMSRWFALFSIRWNDGAANADVKRS